MAFNTKLELYDGKVFQGDGHVLTLSGDTVIATVGSLKYQTHPTFSNNTDIVDKCYVDSSTSAIGANNGLTRRGSNITLGGALTGATTITAGAGTSLLFTDSRTPSIGIQYGGDYSVGFTQRSLVDAAYVTGKTSQAILTANNGLTKVGKNVVLGGTLTGNTFINTASKCLNITGGTCQMGLCMNSTEGSLGTWNGTDGAYYYVKDTSTCRTYESYAISGGSYTYMTGNHIDTNIGSTNGTLTSSLWTRPLSIQLSAEHDAGNCSYVQLRENAVCVGAFGASSTPSSTFPGAQYYHDYSSKYTARSIPDAAWVTGKTSQAILTATNGLTKSGTAVKMGGTLIEPTQLCTNSNVFCFNVANDFGQHIQDDTIYVGSPNNYIEVCEAENIIGIFLQNQDGSSSQIALAQNSETSSAYVESIATNAAGDMTALGVNGCGVKICTTLVSSGDITEITIKPVSVCVSNNRAGFAGIQYGGDYSAGYTQRSLVDAAFVTGKTSQAILTATNGLRKNGTAVELGSALTKSTTINGAQTLRFNVSTLNLTGSTGFALSTGNGVITDTGNKGGLQYAANYGTYVVARSIPDAQWVTGKTSTIATDLSTNYYNKTCINSYSGKTNTRLNTIEADYVTGSTNGISSADVHRLKLGGAITEDTTITGAFLFATNMNRVNITGSTGGVNLGGSVSLKTQPSAALGDVLTINASTGLIGKTTLANLGGLTGATNGIGTTGQKVCLGGALVAATTFTGAYAMNFCNTGGVLMRGTSDMVMDGQSNAGIILKSQSGTLTTASDFTNAIGINMDFNGSSGFNIVDNRAGAAATGIVYNADYSTNYVARSLVDKNYVDTIATGLQVHTAAKVATTGNITLSNTQTIDGIVVSNPDRVLVKNQTDPKQNGIYTVVNAGAWTRTTDFDGSPASEISNGDMIPVTSGSTQNNTIWVVTTKNPIIVGTSNIDFTQFSTVIDIQAGNGIAITQVGGQHTACILLGGGVASTASCGLSISTNGLCISSTLAGCGLTYTAGAMCVNATTGGATAAIPVKFNAGCCLVVNCADINTALNAITGATNGLTKSGQCVKLGGAISEVTTLTLNAGTTGLNITDSRVGTAAVGIQYSGNYGANFTARSIPDAAYVTGKTNAIATNYVCTANNGLTKSGTNVKLGGTLCEATTISVSTRSINFDGDGSNGCFLVGGNSSVNSFQAYGNYMTLNGTYCIRLGASNGGNGANILLANTEATVTTQGNIYGIKYADDYSAGFTARSIPDAAWVTGKTTTTGIQTANNGLTKTGTNVKLGGALTEFVNITYTGTSTCSDDRGFGVYDPNYWGFQVGRAYSADDIYLGDMSYDNTVFEKVGRGGIGLHANNLAQTNITTFALSCTGSILGYVANDTNITSILQTGSDIKVSGSTGFKGIEYRNDYSSKFVARSIPDAAWVTGKTNSIATNYVCTANNGLTKSGTNVKFGGTLCEATTINGAGYAFNLGASSNCLGAFTVCSASFTNSPTGNIVMNAGGTVGICPTGQLTICSGGLISIAKIATYAGDYSANVTARTIPDAAWVTGKTNQIATNYVCTANNGLNKAGNNVRLGGTLTGTTTIGLNGKTLSMTDGSAKYSFLRNSACINTSGATSSVNICTPGTYVIMCNDATDGKINIGAWQTAGGGDIYVCKDFQAFGFNSVWFQTAGGVYKPNFTMCGDSSNVNNKITLSTNSAGNAQQGPHILLEGGSAFTKNVYIATNSGSTAASMKLSGTTVGLTGAVKFNTTPAAGTISDNVIVWNSTDKLLKTVSGAALGDKNNIYSVTAVTTNATLYSGSSYVVLVNNSAPATITLPATPRNGQVFKVKNVSGSALTNPVTIAGNGRNIDGSANALINTDYGALELIYNTTLNAWFSLAFIN